MTTIPGINAKKVLSGLSWTTASQLVRQGMNLFTSIILARLLAPEDFGVVGMASVAVGFASLFRDLGTSSALIQKKEVSETFLSSLAWINGGIGLLLTLVLCALAPWVALFFSEPLLTPMIRVLAANLFFSSLLAVPLTLFTRGLEFDRVARIDIFSTVAGVVVGIVAALQGANAWSLVAQSWAITLVTFLGVMRHGRGWPRLSFSWQEVRPVISYSLHLSGYNLFNYSIRNLDNLFIGKFLGAKYLGYYTVAYRLMLLPLQSVSDVAVRVMFPVFAKIQDDLPQLREGYKKMLAKIALFTFPMMLGLWAVNSHFVATIYGEQWAPVAELLFYLAPIGLLQSLGTTVGLIYQVRGRTDLMLYWGVAVGLLLIPVFWFSAQVGLMAVVIAYAVVSLLLAVPNFMIPCRLIGLRLEEVFTAVASVFATTLMMAAVVRFLARTLLVEPSSWLNLGLLVACGSGIYLLLLHMLNVKPYQESRALVMAALARPLTKSHGGCCGD